MFLLRYSIFSVFFQKTPRTYSVMDIYLIRHTTLDVPAGTCYGQSDVPLATTFAEEAATLQAKLPARWDQVYCSPLSRCRRLAAQLHDQPVQDVRLQELNFGDWEGCLWNDIDPTVIGPWMNDFVHVACPQGESYRQLYERVTAFWQEATNKAPESTMDKRIAIVTHAGPIRALLSHVLTLPLEHSFRLKISHGSISLVRIENQYATIQFINT